MASVSLKSVAVLGHIGHRQRLNKAKNDIRLDKAGYLEEDNKKNTLWKETSNY